MASKKEVIRVALVALLSISLVVIPCNVYAGGCHVLVKQVPVVAAVAYTPIVVARVGDDLENRAVVIKEVREELTRLGIVPNGQQHPQQQQIQAAPPANPIKVNPRGLLANHCARCHQGGNQAATAVWDMRVGLTAEQGWSTINMIINKQNVPDAMKAVINQIKDQEKGTLLDELFALYNTPNLIRNEVTMLPVPKQRVVEAAPEPDYGGF